MSSGLCIYMFVAELENGQWVHGISVWSLLTLVQVSVTHPVTHEITTRKDGDYTLRSTAQDKAHTEARNWLTEHYPDWQNAAAYWD